MHVFSQPKADQELTAAAVWYDERQPGLGGDFLDELVFWLSAHAPDPRQPWENLETSTADNDGLAIFSNLAPLSDPQFFRVQSLQ